ncbi:MAG: sulfite exporter TauE/SafE family protein [Flavobacteriales bacterium]|nr:sulfite exporter TauE/SafE family protein [Flavobacteriales bacterium]
MDYILAILIGVTLGLMGSGGSILTLPVLVYVKGMSAIEGIEDSMFIVGTVAFAGMVRYAVKKEVSYILGLIIVIPSLITVFLTRRFLLPLIPNQLFSINHWVLNKNMFLMIFFAVIMLAAAWMMLRNKTNQNEVKHTGIVQKLLAFVSGSVVGLVTGLVGAGGGFLIVPSLVNFLGIGIRKAIGTSLFIIFINTWWGFFSDGVRENTDWFYLITFTVVAIVGMLIGVWISVKIKTIYLKKAFGFFIIAMGIFILFKEIFLQKSLM